MNLSRFLNISNVLHISKICSNQNIFFKRPSSLGYINSRNSFCKSNRETTQLNVLRSVSTYEAKILQKDDSMLKKVLNKIPFFNIKKTRLISISYLLYETVADELNYIDFFDELTLPDTFYSWFAITELHLWMLCVRAMAEGDDGRLIRNRIIEALWADVGQRSKKLGAGNPAEMRLQINELSEQLQAALIAYDEGLQSSDAVLAAALWRRIYQQKHIYPENLDLLIRYVRRQVKYLDSLSSEQFLDHNNIRWEPLTRKS